MYSEADYSRAYHTGSLTRAGPPATDADCGRTDEPGTGTAGREDVGT